MESSERQEEITIIDKDESGERVVSIVGGFVIEESVKPFPNGKLSFVPEDYGKKDPTPQPARARSKPSTPAVKVEDPSLPPGKTKCEFCGQVGEIESFLAPSRRFCTVTCCKRYSAEKRYYPYGRDEEGVAMSIRQGLVNRHRSLRPNSKPKKAQQTARDERRRRLAYYSSGTAASGAANATGTNDVTPNNRGRRGRRGGSSSAAGTTRVSTGERSNTSTSYLEPYTHPHGTTLRQWSIDDVAEFLTHLGYEAYIDKFQEHEIDGTALSLVRDHHLLMTMKLRLGPTLKIIEHINVLKTMEEADD